MSKLFRTWLYRAGYPIRSVLLGLVALPLFALMVSLSVDTYHRYKEDINGAYTISSAVLARTVAQSDFFINSAKFTLEKLSKRSSIRSLDPKNCDPLLFDLKQLQPAYSTLITLDVKGDLICSATKLQPGKIPKINPANFFNEVSRTQQFTVGKPNVGIVTGRWIAALAYPIFDDSGRFKGAIAAGTDLVNYETVISDENYLPNMSVGIVTKQGIIIAKSGDSVNAVGSIVESPALQVMLKQGKGLALAKNHLGENRFYAFEPIRNTDWIAFASIDESSVVGPILSIALKRLLLILALMTLVAWVTIKFARRLAAHVEGIAQTMNRVTKGSLKERAIPAGSAELRKIAYRLNEMLDARDLADFELKKSTERIKYLAFTDVLTGLPNKTVALDDLNQAIDEATKTLSTLGILYLDLNKLKHVNETYGHAIGDALIKVVGERLTNSMHQNMKAYRILGDEFMVMIKNFDSTHQVSQSCEHILKTLAVPYEVEGLQLAINFSIGVALFPSDGDGSTILLRNADRALAAAKAEGSNNYRFFELDMNSAVTRFMETRDALSLAIERNEFEMYYQPQVALSSGKVVGAEALIRWNRPGYGLVMPSKFIDVAEESGLIIDIGRWVLNDVCRQASHWTKSGLSELVFAVNLSAVQFRQGQIELDVRNALSNHNLNPANLELELTESILLQNDEPVLSLLKGWAAQGIHLSIDDFGTGYSSLSYLKKLAVDKLKIDQSFVKSLGADSEDQAIVKAIIQMAQTLKLATIAEGVEDIATANHLKALGCEQVQGYLYAKSMPASDFLPWALEHNRQN